MRLSSIIVKELFERRSQLITSFIAIVLGITVIVGIRTITHFSEKAVARELDNLGANVLILPKDATVSDYYSADFTGAELPEAYVQTITSSSLQGVDHLSPKLSASVELQGRRVILTGILPKNEFANKQVWQMTGDIFSRPQGCGTVSIPGVTKDTPGSLDRAAVRKEVIETLAQNEVLVGADIANRYALTKGKTVGLLGRTFTVRSVLPQTGTIDDSRLFAHLHVVQQMLGKGKVVSAIEILGCCKEISTGLVTKLNALLPNARVVTVAQITSTQLRTNSLMSQFSSIFLVFILLVGGVSIANYMFANVRERRKEIGTFIAIGMSPRQVVAIFYGKALLLGVIGGIIGYLFGTLLAVWLGPRIAQIPVLPLPILLGWAVLISAAMNMLATIIPASAAARTDPASVLMED